MRLFPRTLLALVGITLLSLPCAAQNWQNVGPDGGDARSFAGDPAHPQHIFLGTTTGWMYESNDNGAHWLPLAKVTANADDMVLDNVVVDEAKTSRLVVGAWVLNHPDGGVFISEDDGHHWRSVSDMRGQSVRALAQSASDPKVFVAGTLTGVYRSSDGGEHWAPISPAGSMEIHEVESIAIDPVHADVIYAGTWHLPWKTDDGGKTWHSIKEGLIVDSDVFSIIIDPTMPSTVYASACSGIYKSLDGGGQFHKIQGIPSAARRTRVLMQDPLNHDVVYAGTTEGLYKTVNAGTTWKLMTPSYLIINDVHIDPKNTQHVFLATDRSGVLESDNGMQSYRDASVGFTQRQVAALAVDVHQPNNFYVGLLNDKRFGGVFFSPDSGATWIQRSNGLDDRDVYALVDSSSGNLLAGTSHGMLRWTGTSWDDVSNRMKETSRRVTHAVRKKHGRTYITTHVTTTETVATPDGKIDVSVRGLAYADGQWYAATAAGLYRSPDTGFAWLGGPVMGATDFRNVSAQGSNVLANAGYLVYGSVDGGKTWKALPLPSGWRRVRTVVVDESGRYWIGGRQGVATSDDQGQTWKVMHQLPIVDISGLTYDAQLKRVMITSYESNLIFGVDPATMQYTWWNAGWHTHAVQSFDNRLVAATLLHGVVVQPAQSASATAH
ncbi:MAG TPA: transcriptional regulator [Acidobacteriaceae bacterium]|jgi:photosystem II stability/assembly factor-like uncharacterized protein|nr:transcriptional regulator [Acidobacteriaceae bacterium]